MSHPVTELDELQSRRSFLSASRVGLGATACASLLTGSNAAADPEKASQSRAKRVIFLFMAGAPSQVDLFDYKPDLHKHFKTELPQSVRKGQRVTAMTRGKQKLVAPSTFKFAQQGKSGVWMCELLPHLSGLADDLCLVHSFNTNAINHDPGKTSFCTGAEIPGKPSMGSWLSYGLGSLNKDLPDFVVMPSAFWSGRVNVQALYARLWGSGFLPSKFQGTSFQTVGDPVLFLSNPKGIDGKVRRTMLDSLARLNQKHLAEIGDPEIRTTIAQQEMAFRMQSSVPELTDISGEPKNVLEMYGPEVNKLGSYARNCLLARRMVERDVRFVQLFHRGWDHHSRLPDNMRGQCKDVDQPTAALLKDLKSRGLLKDTLVVFVGEFGRTVFGQGNIARDNYGRDHHPRCFSGWVAGGGIKGGMHYGKTDDFAYNILENPVHVNDLNATVLHCLGIDHERFTHRYLGLDQRLTGVEGSKVIHDILA